MQIAYKFIIITTNQGVVKSVEELGVYANEEQFEEALKDLEKHYEEEGFKMTYVHGYYRWFNYKQISVGVIPANVVLD